ncbi:MAG: hypothetical protein JNK87_18540 [Bryobacterales bacterium]|nr:hypothetical protein [Bryobacterales bacterium]
MSWLPLFAVSIATLFPGGDATGYEKVPAPGVRYRMNMATATSAPWIDSNLWRYRRKPDGKYLCDVKGKPAAALAMAEGFVTGINLTLDTTPDQKAEYDKMAAFLKALPGGPRQPWTNFSISDDGTFEAGEVMNLLSRRNLLYRIVPAAKADFKLEKPANPYEYVLNLRDKFGDDKRVFRLFGSELTVAEVAREGRKVRIHLINYGSRPVDTMRLRVRGNFAEAAAKAYIYGSDDAKLSEWQRDGAFTEFTLTALPLYGVIDLEDAAR